MILRNNRIRAVARPISADDRDEPQPVAGNSQPNDRYEVFVYDYQRQAGNNFRVYFREQATQNLYGGLAPCTDTTTRPEIDGITCPATGGPLGPPSPVSGLHIRPAPKS